MRFCTRLVRDDFKGQLGAFTPCFTDIVILGEIQSLFVDAHLHTHTSLGQKDPHACTNMLAKHLTWGDGDPSHRAYSTGSRSLLPLLVSSEAAFASAKHVC